MQCHSLIFQELVSDCHVSCQKQFWLCLGGWWFAEGNNAGKKRSVAFIIITADLSGVMFCPIYTTNRLTSLFEWKKCTSYFSTLILINKINVWLFLLPRCKLGFIDLTWLFKWPFKCIFASYVNCRLLATPSSKVNWSQKKSQVSWQIHLFWASFQKLLLSGSSLKW